MKEKKYSPSQTKKQANHALRDALAILVPSVEMDQNGYVPSFLDNLLPAVNPEDFEADVRRGDGNELGTKFRAAHSSTALCVNCFAPFRSRLADLSILGKQGFDNFHFERKCPTGLRGHPPNLDILLEGGDGVVGIESKLTEYFSRHKAEFSTTYKEKIRDHRRNSGWFREMLRLMDEPRAYSWLNVAQLIKHAFGLDHCFPGKSTTLLYLFWEPAETQGHPVFAEHRNEIDDFSKRIAGIGPQFRAISYPEMWNAWQRTAPEWLTDHVRNLSARYRVHLDPHSPSVNTGAILDHRNGRII